jgi:uncharacterized protein
MGHCHSSAQFSGKGGVFAVERGVTETASPRGEARKAKPVAGQARAAGTRVLLFFVRLYQVFLSPFLGGACKFYPSCSNYAQEAIARHGARRGMILALKRLGRCRPFTEGGFDPVPDEPESLATHPVRTELAE